MEKAKNKIGIMGGTFNPIHYAHLVLAENAYEQFQLDKIMFLPSKRPAYKPLKELVSNEHRLAMIQAAISKNPHFYVSDLEFHREGNTYTVDTLRQLTKENKTEQYYFILGGDSLFHLEQWKEPDEILKLCHLIVAIRQEIQNKIVLEKKVKELSKKYKAKIFIMDTPFLDISSSMIRKRLEKKQSIRYFLPEEVLEYIQVHQLYQKP